jgi:hypothetical protein
MERGAAIEAAIILRSRPDSVDGEGVKGVLIHLLDLRNLHLERVDQDSEAVQRRGLDE